MCPSKGEAGKPAALYKLASSGLSPQAYRTETGCCISLFHTITLLFSILACAHWYFHLRRQWRILINSHIYYELLVARHKR